MASQGYRAQLPNSIVRRVVDRRPGVGEAIAQGVATLGNTLGQVADLDADTRERIAQSEHRIALIDQQRTRAAAVADGMGRFAEVQLQTEQEVQQLRDTAPPGGGDSAVQAEELYRKRWDEFSASLGKDPEVQQHFAPMGARWLGAGIGQSRDWERGQRVKYLGDQFETSLDTNAAALYAQPTVDAYQAMIGDNDAAIDMQLIDGNAKSAMKQLVRQKLTSALFEGTLATGNTEAVKSALATGKFDQWIGGADGAARWSERADAVHDGQVRKAEAAQAEVRQTAEDNLETLQARIEQGENVSQAEIETGLSSARAAGVDGAKLVRFAGLGDRAVTRQAARQMPTRQLEAQAEALGAKRASGKASPADLRALDEYDKEIDARDDKGATAVGTLWKGGDAERSAAVAQLHAMPLGERMRVAGKVGGTIGVLASLPARNAETALRGGAIRKDRPDAFMPVKDGKADASLARDAFNRFLGSRLMNALGGDYDKVLNTALDLYVGSKANAGDAGAWNEGEFRDAIRIVYGQTRRRDGSLQGGLTDVRGRMVELPAGWNGAEFDRSLSRLTFDRAVYADGSRANKADILGNYSLVVEKVTDGGQVQYRLEDARGRALLRNDGQTYRVIFNRAPQAAINAGGN